jgi:hypothetical protein
LAAFVAAKTLGMEEVVPGVAPSASTAAPGAALLGGGGFAFHFLRGFWCRFLVDVKLHGLRALMPTEGLTLQDAVRQEFGYEILQFDFTWQS